MDATGAVYELQTTDFPTSNASFLGGYQTDALSLALPHDGGGDGSRQKWLKRFPLIMIMRGIKGEV